MDTNVSLAFQELGKLVFSRSDVLEIDVLVSILWGTATAPSTTKETNHSDGNGRSTGTCGRWHAACSWRLDSYGLLQERVVLSHPGRSVPDVHLNKAEWIIMPCSVLFGHIQNMQHTFVLYILLWWKEACALDNASISMQQWCFFFSHSSDVNFAVRNSTSVRIWSTLPYCIWCIQDQHQW